MRSLVAESLRREGRDKLRALSADERMALALRLGEDDLNLLISAQGLDRESARQRIRAQRQRGRRRSRLFD